MTTAYDNRPACYADVPGATWLDWQWQQRQAARSGADLLHVYPALDPTTISLADAWAQRGLRFQITPYQQATIRTDEQGNPRPHDPIWRQFFPVFPTVLLGKQRLPPDEYSPQCENWESPEEKLTPIAHHKYDDRVILYVADVCLSYCGYCLRSMQSTAPEESHGSVRVHWQATLDAVRANPDIREIILSGGDPLVLSNAEIDRMLSDIRAIESIATIRIHTRALSHNPYRIDDDFCQLLRQHRVTVFAVHVAHAQELTEEFKQGVERIRASGALAMLLGQIPLIKGVNDNEQALRELFLGLYELGIKPYYLFHSMPNIPAAAAQRTSVRRGAELMARIGRTLCHPALPEYIIAHSTGKRTVPLVEHGTDDFVYEQRSNGHPVVRFVNWKGEWQVYLDGIDA